MGIFEGGGGGCGVQMYHVNHLQVPKLIIDSELEACIQYKYIYSL